ncbi:hypothetical protein FB563_6331 [Streptomyces puniciscabiei]|uniref:Uncharacterized protein n=2 Tax=Streptomyces puniciscabiei TaxID=164348 RepID=A0A542THA5_9ACTN|nr:hypothetical protein FB563_6331 [Streptomyces puniciscabiei]
MRELGMLGASRPASPAGLLPCGLAQRASALLGAQRALTACERLLTSTATNPSGTFSRLRLRNFPFRPLAAKAPERLGPGDSDDYDQVRQDS